MKTIKGKKYLLHWTLNPATYNEKLEDLIKSNQVQKIKGEYYTIVTARFTGNFNVVDCTLDKKGNFYPINTDNLMSSAQI